MSSTVDWPPTADQIQLMNYNELISVVRETNRPPGGLRTIALIAQNSFLTRESRVLEIGTSTGITAIELARTIGCKITAIDINERSLAEARDRADQTGVGHLVTFECTDATDTGYSEGSFDLVFCGNVTSLIAERDRALLEYDKVLKTGGYIAAVPMYYCDTPSAELIKEVAEAIGVDIDVHYRDFWIDFFTGCGHYLYWHQDFRFDKLSAREVNEFAEEILERTHLHDLDEEARLVLSERYRQFMQLFRMNLSHMGFTCLLTRKEKPGSERELFTSSPVQYPTRL